MMSGPAHGGECWSGQVTVTFAGAGLVPSDAMRRDTSSGTLTVQLREPSPDFSSSQRSEPAGFGAVAPSAVAPAAVALSAEAAPAAVPVAAGVGCTTFAPSLPDLASTETRV